MSIAKGKRDEHTGDIRDFVRKKLNIDEIVEKMTNAIDKWQEENEYFYPGVYDEIEKETLTEEERKFMYETITEAYNKGEEVNA